jgi:phosphate starvation-inducible PhoH-like protein
MEALVEDLTFTTTTTLTRSQRKKLKRENNVNKIGDKNKQNLSLKRINPVTNNQDYIFKHYNEDKNILIHGLPGTGKTFISLYLALNEVMNLYNFKKVVIVRSVVPTRDMGFLPGNKAEKTKEYEAPYYSICTELFGRGDAYEVLKQKGMIEFMPTSFIRGVTLSDCVIILDECQNNTFHELDSVITRMGENTKIMICGDFRQSDLRFKDERQGLLDFMDILGRMKSFAHVELTEDDIVRSGTVREYIISKTKLGLI